MTMNKINLRRMLDVLIGIVVVVFLTFGYIKYNRTNDTYSAQLSREKIQEILIKEYENSSLNPAIQSNRWQFLLRKTRELPTEYLSRNKFFSSILAKNRTDRIGVVVQSCDALCEGVNEGYAYPIPINQAELIQLRKDVKNFDYPELIIIDIRAEEEYLKSHIPGAVNIPMHELVESVFPMNRWFPLVVVGNSYEETRIASEALYKLLFHYIYRFQYPYHYWNGETETFIADGE